jgi:hypothetical protein
MKAVAQDLSEILASLRPLTVEWQDATSRRVTAKIEALPVKSSYAISDVQALLDAHFEDGLLICRLFLKQSKDQFTTAIKAALKGHGHGILRYREAPKLYLEALLALGILEEMGKEVNRVPKWSDVLIERLRSGRGSAISGQRRGRQVEDFAEKIVREVVGDKYEVRCTFSGPHGKTAKCDFAIPGKTVPAILIEAKGYGATGSKMTDVIGDIEKIITAKRPDTALLFFTDGLTWKERQSDLKKIVAYQNAGYITRIYTYALAEQFKSDLVQLKQEYEL